MKSVVFSLVLGCIPMVLANCQELSFSDPCTNSTNHVCEVSFSNQAEVDLSNILKTLGSDIELILHRGGSDFHPENSLNGIMAAWDMGVSSEIDIQLSSDLIPFLLHDVTLARTVNALPEHKDVPVCELPYKTIQQYHLYCDDQSRCPPPMLDTVLELLSMSDTRQLTLDIKDPNIYPIVYELIKKYDVEHQIFFTAPEIESLAEIKKAFPNTLTSLWVRNLSTKDDSIFMQGINSSVVDSITYCHFGKTKAVLESEETIQKALDLTREHKQLTLAIYSNTWKPGMIKKLHEQGIRRFMIDHSYEFYNEFTSPE